MRIAKNINVGSDKLSAGLSAALKICNELANSPDKSDIVDFSNTRFITPTFVLPFLMLNRNSMVMKTYNIAELLGKDLISRPLVHDFYNYIIKETKVDDSVAIDFSEVNFITRSFMDEFYNVFMDNNQCGMKVCMINMKEDFVILLDSVKSTQNKKKVASSDKAQYVKAKDLKEVDQCFASFSI